MDLTLIDLFDTTRLLNSYKSIFRKAFGLNLDELNHILACLVRAEGNVVRDWAFFETKIVSNLSKKDPDTIRLYVTDLRFNGSYFDSIIYSDILHEELDIKIKHRDYADIDLVSISNPTLISFDLVYTSSNIIQKYMISLYRDLVSRGHIKIPKDILCIVHYNSISTRDGFLQEIFSLYT